MTHAHLTSLVLSLILFIIIVFMQNSGKKIKVMHMVLRASYILVLATGCMLFFSVYSISFSYILKALFGIVMIGLFEMVIVRGGKGKSTSLLWILFVVVLAVLFYLGITLPMGIYLG